MDLKQRIELTQQTLDALESINNNGGKVPDGYVLEYSLAHGNAWKPSGFVVDPNRLDSEAHYRLTPIPQPRRVPLTLADVAPGSVFSFAPNCGWLNASVNVNGIVYATYVVKTWTELH